MFTKGERDRLRVAVVGLQRSSSDGKDGRMAEWWVGGRIASVRRMLVGWDGVEGETRQWRVSREEGY